MCHAITLFILVCAVLVVAYEPTRGLNYPRTTENSNQGNFLPGVFQYSYTLQNFTQILPAKFTGVRLGVNVETAMNTTVLARLRGYAEVFAHTGSASIVCMWDTLKQGEKGHGDGRVNNNDEMIQAWKNIAEAFKGTHVLFEIFNEPFGYTTAHEYLAEMTSIIKGAELNESMVILDGTGYADDVRALSDAGWNGMMAYHIYPNWMPSGKRTQENYSNLVQGKLKGLSERVFITEFGADLTKKDYKDYDPNPNDGNVNLLRGLNDAVTALYKEGAGVRGMFNWHGWNNGDSYSYFNPTSHAGPAEVRLILASATGL